MMMKCYRSMLATQLAITVLIVSGILALAGMILAKHKSNHVSDGRVQVNKTTK